MPLDFPFNYSENSFDVAQSISHENLDKLLTIVNNDEKLTRQDVVTKEAIKCFEFIKKNRPGCAHTCAKYSSILTVQGVAYAGPVVGTVYGIKYTWDNSLIDLSKSYENPVAQAIAAFVGTTFLIEGVARLNGLSLIKPIIAHTLLSYNSAVSYLTRGVERAFNKSSDRAEEVNINTHKNIVANQTTTYDGMANDLHRRFNAFKDDPQALLNLKHDSAKMLAALPQIIKGFKKYEINPAEAELILSKFSSKLNAIINEKIALRSGATEQDLNYNIKLLINFPVTAEHCLTAKAHTHIANAKKSELGLGHTIMGYIAPTVAGGLSLMAIPALAAVSTLVSNTAAMAIKQLTDGFASCKLENNIPTCPAMVMNDWTQTAVLAGMTAATFGAAFITQSHVSHNYQAQQTKAELRIAQENQKARVETLSVYEGIAGHMRHRLALAKYNRSALKTLKAEAAKFQDKLPEIASELDKSNIKNFSAQDALGELYSALLMIQSA